MRDDLIEELEALLEEHEWFVTNLPHPNATSNVYYIELLGRIAETLDAAFAQTGATTPEVGGVVWRACSALGLALLVADLTAEMAKGSRLPATRAFRRWFPEEQVERLRGAAAGREPGVG